MNTETAVSSENQEELKKPLKYWPDDMTDEELVKVIDENGLKGRLGVKTIRIIPPLELLNLCMNDYPIHQIASLYDRSSATIAALRKFYEIRQEDLIKKGLIPEPKSWSKPKAKVEPEPESEIESKPMVESEPKYEFKAEPLIAKTITAPAQAAAGELVGTAKFLDRLGDKEVTVEITVRRINR